MKIDQTRFDAFWQNPEKYRLTYECNLVPKSMARGLARGLALHEIAEQRVAGRSFEEIEAVLKGEAPNLRGEFIQEPIPDEPRKAAWAMYAAFEAEYPLNNPAWEVVGTESEFTVVIPGSPHQMVGRVDQILSRNGELWCGELKTANAKKRFDNIVEDWSQKSQADFEILGARSLGFEVAGVWVRTIVEKTPVAVWPLDVRRSEHQLSLKMLAVHQTCETIQLYRNVFGIEQPWPHLPWNYPCCRSGACEYERICGRAFSDLTAEDLQDFKQRQEHLGLMKEAA